MARRWSRGFAQHLRHTRWGSSPTTGSCSPKAALKGAHFIELCAQRGIPLVFLQNISGFMVGRKYENARHRARTAPRWSRRSRRAQVPKIHHADRRLSSAPAITACAGAPIAPRFLWSWPNSRISVMGGEQAAASGQRAPRRHRGAGRRWSAEDEEAFSAPIREQYETKGNPYYATARLWDDGIIDPAQTPARARRCRFRRL